jgi:lipopolysaccharide/colanic/teichoic acid biosynthesis glycosyltransferase
MMASLLGLVVLSPLLVVIGILTLIVSPGPVLFRGVRTGRYGKDFRIFKFRTMVVDAENIGGSTTALGDARITTFGHYLRKYKLDELPQLLNVLFGDMSLVGPRPEMKEYTDRYTAEENLILTFRPGITDLASLHFIDLASHVGAGDADATYVREVLKTKNTLRVRYVREAGFWKDLEILSRTMVSVISRFLKGCLPWK